MTFSILQVSIDRERLLTASGRHWPKLKNFQTMYKRILYEESIAL